MSYLLGPLFGLLLYWLIKESVEAGIKSAMTSAAFDVAVKSAVTSATMEDAIAEGVTAGIKRADLEEAISRGIELHQDSKVTD
jgi:hypothetical protein